MIALVPVRTAAPAILPVSLADAKLHLGYDAADRDAEIAAFVAAAVARLDGWGGVLGRCLVAQTWRQPLSGFPSGPEIVLPFPDVASATIAYTDTAGSDQTVSAADWSLHETSVGAAIVLDDDASWPSTATRPDAVRITFTAGYGAAASDVPQPIRSAILLMTGDLWRSREAGSAPAGALGGVADLLLAPYRRVPV